MTVLPEVHERHGATFREYDGRRVVDSYGRPDRTHRAVRKGVGVIETRYGILQISGDDRVEFVDNAVTNAVPTENGRGVYALLLDPQGRIETDLYVYNAGERLLCFTPPGEAAPLAASWRENVFIQDVDIENATDDLAVFGVHGPTATEKVASVLHGGVGSPDEEFTFVRGSMGEAGVSVIRTDNLPGEEGYEVVCAADDAHEAFETLITRGNNAVPFGYRTWESLTLEAGTPMFETELDGTVPNVLGLRNALDFSKGCYVGQEVVSKIENRGRPSRRLVGLALDSVPDPGAAVFAGDSHAGEVTRAGDPPLRESPVALAFVGFGDDLDTLTVRVDGEQVAASHEPLPFVDGSERSARLPEY
jgi:aminomethyltransferase